MTVLPTLLRRRLALALVIVFLIHSIYVPNLILNDMDVLVDEIERSDQSIAAYTNNDPIIISSDSDFVIQGWPGLGTFASPYIIENLNISTSITCILIANTTKHFVIRDNWFTASGQAWGDGIVTFDNVTNGRIENNNFNGIHSAITVYSVADCAFTGNLIGTEILGLYAFNINTSLFADNVQTLPEIRYPVHVQVAHGFIVRNNSFHGVSNEGIRLALGYDCVVEDNRFLSDGTPYLGQFGIIFRESYGGAMTRNEISGFDTNLEVLDGSNNHVYNNTFTNSWRGMRLRTTRATVENNEIRTSFKGIELRKSNSCVIESNEIQGYPDNSYGIESRVGNNTRISLNEIHSVDIGIQLQGGMGDKILENIVYDSRIGVSLEENQGITYEDIRRRDYDRYEEGAPIGSTIVNNTFLDCGISFIISDPAGFDQNIVGNTINGGLLGYFYNWSDKVIEGNEYRQIILARSSEVLIDGGELSGITLIFCTNSEIRNVNVSQTGFGIHIVRSTGCIVSNSESSNNDIGIYIDQSDSCFVYYSRVHGNGYGIFLDETTNSLVYGCEISQNEYGVLFVGAHDSIIESNSIHTNLEGIYLLRTNDALVGNNDIIYNWGHGILINRLSSGNSIVGNNIGWNAVNAECTGTENHWDNGFGLGNRWHDYFNTSTYVIDDGDVDRFPRILGDGLLIPIPTEDTNSTKVDLLSLTPLQAIVATVMIGGVLGIALANYMFRKFPK